MWILLQAQFHVKVSNNCLQLCPSPYRASYCLRNLIVYSIRVLYLVTKVVFRVSSELHSVVKDLEVRLDKLSEDQILSKEHVEENAGLKSQLMVYCFTTSHWLFLISSFSLLHSSVRLWTHEKSRKKYQISQTPLDNEKSRKNIIKFVKPHLNVTNWRRYIIKLVKAHLTVLARLLFSRF